MTEESLPFGPERSFHIVLAVLDLLLRQRHQLQASLLEVVILSFHRKVVSFGRDCMASRLYPMIRHLRSTEDPNPV